MCYYYGQKVSRDEYIRLKDVERQWLREQSPYPVINGFNYPKCTVLKATDDRRDFELADMEWGFIPNYIRTREDVKKMRSGYKDAKGFRPPLTMLNARSDEMLKPGKVFRDAVLKRRCLVLATGFYEWQHVYPINKKTGEPLKTANKYPYSITVKDKPYFYMAGIWQPWTDKETGEYVETFAIVTTEANSLMAQVHNSKLRMPTILDDERAYQWLFGDLSEDQILELGVNQCPTEEMGAFTIPPNFRELEEPGTAFVYEGLAPLVL